MTPATTVPLPDPAIESLLPALQDDAPSGPDLEYDPEFLALEDAATGKPEQQYGDTIIPAVDPDWPAAHQHAMQLARRTRDLRVAVWLTRSGARLEGLAGAVRGLQLVQGLLDAHWDDVHPQLDASDSNDPTMRLNALAPLVHPDAVLADLRAAVLTATRGSLTVRDIELGLGRAEPLPGESVPTEAGVLSGLAVALAESPRLAQLMQSAHDAVLKISTLIEERLGAGRGPDFAPLKNLTQLLAQASRRATGSNAAPELSKRSTLDAGLTGARSAGVAAGPIETREDAISALQNVCEWIEHNEPSHPAPLLIRRAQRLMSKTFIDIIRDLMPDGVDHIEKLAGVAHQ